MDTSGVQLLTEAFHQRDLPAQTFHFATCNGRGQHIGAKFNAVGDNGVSRAVQTVDSLDDNLGCAVAFDLRAHFAQAVGQIDDFGLAGRIPNDGGALCKGRGHQDILGRANRCKGQLDLVALQATWRLGVQIAVFQLDLGAQLLKAVDVQVHRTGANGATAGQRHHRMAQTCQHRPQHQI